MKAARITSPRRFEFIDEEMPVPEEGQVRIRVERVSVCGSDLRTYDPVLAEEEYPLPVGRPCHEVLGVIEESRTNELHEGQRVIVLPTTTGGLVEHLVESPSRIIPIPDDGGDLAVWLMCQPMGTVLHSCQRTGSVLGKSVAVLGQGAIGLNFTTWMARQGATQVIVVDNLDYRLELARELGATHVINAVRDDVGAAVAEITGGEGADVVIEAAGEMDTVNQAVHVVRRYGHVTFFGVTWDGFFPFDFATMFDKQITTVATSSARSGNPTKAIKECVDIVAQGRLDLSRLVTHRTTFDDVQQAYDMYSEKLDNVIKVVMTM
jgi:L-iditol 2-dehydrogenase